MHRKTAALLLTTVTSAVLIAGCGVVQQTTALPADAFVANQPVVGSSAGQGIDHPGQLVYDEHKRPPHEASEATRISPTVAEAVKNAPDIGSETSNGSDFPPPKRTPTTASAATQSASGMTSGRYETIGAVVAVVNAEPIYADKIIAKIERPLKAEALAHDEAHFRITARDLVSDEMREMIKDALEYAAAQKSMEKKDEQYADYATNQWRKTQVQKAGGSEALARQKAAEEGQNFEDLVGEQHRIAVIQIFYQNKIYSRIQVSSQDMRQYYRTNIALYQKIAAAKFRVIWIGADKTGSREAALDKARTIIERAHHGEDFADLAGMFNDDPSLLQSRGKVGDQNGWIEKDAYVHQAVNAAVWKLRPTEISDPIPASYNGHDGYWIARLEDVRPGETLPFESQRVQESIKRTLEQEQFVRRHEQLLRKLLSEMVMDQNKDADAILMEMVMQKYHGWMGK